MCKNVNLYVDNLKRAIKKKLAKKAIIRVDQSEGLKIV